MVQGVVHQASCFETRIERLDNNSEYYIDIDNVAMWMWMTLLSITLIMLTQTTENNTEYNFDNTEMDEGDNSTEYKQ